eukprot:CAMPEP_0206449168 /NCGR_PEP_ID=MMETSP0324_2-20121206/17930_1 /ASSEMBLY_ACC=CAM_ASM_000836 /TAXON_ID=2866 /ORGANISM="Crypthecodinium cohnii, Strain Seligo" /LENGTH=771 /DNA_ID=CAMNT_0053918497 /DNA_START=59 /DNA_END=2374 /DNA_ORIENTATION=+
MKRSAGDADFNIGGRLKPTLGAPHCRPTPERKSTYVTKGKVLVICEVEEERDPVLAVKELTEALDKRRGCLLSSSYEYPGRYTEWTVGFVDPPLAIESWGLRFRIKALNARGKLFLPIIAKAIGQADHLLVANNSETEVNGSVKETDEFFPEEERSRKPTIFSLVRVLRELFSSDEDSHLGLYGAFGYDLAFQFENIKLHKERDPEQRDVVLYVPDSILVINHHAKQAWRMQYDFAFGDATGVSATKGVAREEVPSMINCRTEMPKGMSKREYPEGEFAKMVDKAKEKFACGDLFEAVISQTFKEPCSSPPSVIFNRLQERNPSPYGFLMNLGENECLVGASPEMFVRVESNPRGLRCETCPISGTIKRGRDALEDAENIRKILTDPKEESEITMCTDVDRNDKSRICQHGSVQVIGRRQIEMYSRLIHTVDHVEGYLRPEFDALDAFLCHMWAVTVSGAPKTWAMQFLEEIEVSQRRWYGASVGHIAFDGHLNTGLTLRTVRVKDGVAEVRAGATLLFDSVPESEEKETELKASACLNAVTSAQPISKPPAVNGNGVAKECYAGKHVLLVDFEDSFVHTLANYIRQTGATVTTVRHSSLEVALKTLKTPIDLAVLSPGPGCPKDFDVSSKIKLFLERKVRIFGVCLGLQSIVEHFGGTLGQLTYPMHGKPVKVEVVPGSPSLIFEGLPPVFGAARYHSLYATKLPDCLAATALTVLSTEHEENKRSGQVVMGIQHKTLPIAAVQFHPESILTSPDHGLQMLRNAFKLTAV